MLELAVLGRIIIVLALVAVCLWLVRSYFLEQRHRQRIREQVRLVEEQKRTRAQRIIQQGGPQSRDEYFLLFPDACPVCGGRIRQEGMHQSAVSAHLPALTPTPYEPQRIWYCPRCGFGNIPDVEQNAHHTRKVLSPYADEQFTDTIPELAYTPPYATTDILEEDGENDKLYCVYLHNDNITPMQFVVLTLVQVFDVDLSEASDIMEEAHIKQRALIAKQTISQAQRMVELGSQLAREQNFPLTFTIEPLPSDDVA